MKTMMRKPLVNAITAAITAVGLSACGGTSDDTATNPIATLKATVNDSLVAGADVSVHVLNDQGASVTVSINVGKSGADGKVSVIIDTIKLGGLNPMWPVILTAHKALAHGERLHFETYLGSVEKVLMAAADGTVDMASEGDHPEISNTGMAKMQLIHGVFEDKLLRQGVKLRLNQIPAGTLYNPTLWNHMGAEFSEAIMLSSIAVKAIVDYSATIDSAHVTDYDKDGFRDTKELVRQIGHDIVKGMGRSLDYYIKPDVNQLAYDTAVEIVSDISASVAANPTDPLSAYGKKFAGQGDFADHDTKGMKTLFDNMVKFAEGKLQVSTLDCANISVTSGNVYTLNLSWADSSTPFDISYTALAGDTPATLTAALAKAINDKAIADPSLKVFASVSATTVTIAGKEKGLSFTVQASAKDSSGMAMTSGIPTFDAGAAVMMSWTLPVSVTSHMDTLNNAFTTLVEQINPPSSGTTIRP